jgi:hypothetical protein
VDDHGWNQIGFEGLQRIAKELGAEVAYRQVGSAKERVEGLRAYAGQGFQLVFGHGEEYSAPVAQVAPAFPKRSPSSTIPACRSGFPPRCAGQVEDARARILAGTLDPLTRP